MVTKKLPKYVFQRKWGSYQYKRNVPNRLKTLIGKATLYRFLGKSYDEMIVSLSVVHKEIEALFSKLPLTSTSGCCGAARRTGLSRMTHAFLLADTSVNGQSELSLRPY